jgi:selenocysteine-specific elongation factor
MSVIGTAGHVDHGKSSLVEAITGINPDRLAEEQRRQMTIDLGFAWLTLPDGESVGIVDVPGHRDFIENMLAGAGGIDAVLFVVAADEGGPFKYTKRHHRVDEDRRC